MTVRHWASRGQRAPVCFPGEAAWAGAKVLSTQGSKEGKGKLRASLLESVQGPLLQRSSPSFGLATDQGHGTIQQVFHGHRHELGAGLRSLGIRQSHEHLRPSKLRLLQSDHLLS